MHGSLVCWTIRGNFWTSRKWKGIRVRWCFPLSQIEDLRLSITRMEKESGRREDVLRQEISDLQQVLSYCHLVFLLNQGNVCWLPPWWSFKWLKSRIYISEAPRSRGQKPWIDAKYFRWWVPCVFIVWDLQAHNDVLHTHKSIMCSFTSVPISASKPLLRQIENLQSTCSAQTSSYETVEKNLTERLGEFVRQVAGSGVVSALPLHSARVRYEPHGLDADKRLCCNKRKPVPFCDGCCLHWIASQGLCTKEPRYFRVCGKLGNTDSWKFSFWQHWKHNAASVRANAAHPASFSGVADHLVITSFCLLLTITAESQEQLAHVVERERAASEKVIEVTARLSSLESQVSTLRQEKSRLTAELEMERAKAEMLEETKLTWVPLF